MSPTAAVEDLREACLGLGLTVATPAAGDDRADLVIDAGAGPVAVDVVATSLADGGAARRLLALRKQREGARVVVADRVVGAAREALSEAGVGWLDRRGWLFLRVPGIYVNAPVPATYRPPVTTQPLRSPVGREVAVSLLLDGPARSVRGLARALGRSPGAVSTTLAALRADGLVDDEGTGAVPALFWALAEHWPVGTVHLGREPHPDDPRVLATLDLGLIGDVETTPGWVVTDSLAAAAYGAPVAIGSGFPPDFVVPEPYLVRRAERVLGRGTPEAYGATVRVAPVPALCARRVDGAERGFGDTHWPLAQPLFVALDLATDPGRGREVLDAWTPPEPWRRVW